MGPRSGVVSKVPQATPTGHQATPDGDPKWARGTQNLNLSGSFCVVFCFSLLCSLQLIAILLPQLLSMGSEPSKTNTALEAR